MIRTFYNQNQTNMSNTNIAHTPSTGGLIGSTYGSGQLSMMTRGDKNLRDGSGCPSLMNLATYNGLTLRTDDRLHELELELEKINWDIIGLCEVRRKGEERLELNSGHIFYYRGTEKGGHNGVGFIVNRKYKNNILEFDSSSDRVARVVIQISKRYTFQITQIYAPTTSYTDEEIEDFYEEVSEMHQKGNSYVKVIMGDFNAGIGCKKDASETAVGNFGFGDRNDRGDRLVEFAEQEQLCILNSHFKKKPHRKWTWCHPTGYKSEKDYILTNRRHLFEDCTVLNRFNTGSDHRLVRAKIKFDKKIERTKLIRRKNVNINIDKLREKKDEFQEKIECVISSRPNCDQDINTMNIDMSKMVKEVALEVAGRKEKKCNKKVTEETRKLMDKRRTMRLEINDVNNNIEYRDLCKTIRKRLRDDIRKYNTDIVQKAIEDNTSLKQANKKLIIGKNEIFTLKKENGESTKNPNEIIKIVETFYNNLYGDSTKEQMIVINNQDSDVPSITTDEVWKVMRKMKNGKSPGEDGVSIDILKEAGNEFYNLMANLFNKCILMCDIPDDWKNALMILIHKKGDKKDIGNYRPISLLSVMYKIFTGILANRIEDVLERSQSKEQAGFRRNFSTLDHIQTVRELIERHIEFEMPLCLAFVDFEKAFDSVKTSAVIKSLEEGGVESTYINVLNTIYNSASATIEIHNQTAKINLEKGVRQGDTISPKLFIAVLEMVFKKLNWENKGILINNEYLNHLRFADDIVVMSNNTKELESMLKDLTDTCLEIGLKMNLSKTKIMYNAFIRKQDIKINNVLMEEVKSYIYLGQEITMDGDITSEINRRIRLAWSSFGKHSTVFKTLTYAAETWALTVRSIHRLQTTQRSMERSMLGFTRRDRKRNTWIRAKTKVMDVIERVKRLKWRWAGHVLRRTDRRWTTNILNWNPVKKRARGRPRLRWRDEIKKVAGEDWRKVAEDRFVWKNLEETFIQQWIDNG
ncbi:hypothetical protein WDU94_003530 [Cyamophila willieti]